MTNTTNTVKRNSPAKKSGNGIKALIMAGSLAATIGGWGILALGQIQGAVVAQQSQFIVQPVNSQTTNNSSINNSGTQLRQVSPSTTQPRSVGRTRSSR